MQDDTASQRFSLFALPATRPVVRPKRTFLCRLNSLLYSTVYAQGSLYSQEVPVWRRASASLRASQDTRVLWKTCCY